MTEGIISADQSPARLQSDRSKNLQAKQIMAAARQNKTLMKRQLQKAGGKRETLRIDSDFKDHELADKSLGFKLPYAQSNQPTSRASVAMGPSMTHNTKDEEKFARVTRHPEHSLTISG